MQADPGDPSVEVELTALANLAPMFQWPRFRNARRRRVRWQRARAATGVAIVVTVALLGAATVGRNRQQTGTFLVAGPGEPSISSQPSVAPNGLPLLGKVVVTSTRQTLAGTFPGHLGPVAGTRVYWLSEPPQGLPGAFLSYGVKDSLTGRVFPNQGLTLNDDLSSVGIHDFTEVDNGDAVALISGDGTVVSSIPGVVPHLYDLGYADLHLAVVPGNDGRSSTLTYRAEPGESVSDTQIEMKVSIP